MTLPLKAYKLAVVQTRASQEWISGMQQAIDLSSSGEVNEGKFESEAEVARKKMEAEYRRMRQLPSELRGRDRKRAQLL